MIEKTKLQEARQTTGAGYLATGANGIDDVGVDQNLGQFK
jgi:hypothetical protein